MITEDERFNIIIDSVQDGINSAVENLKDRFGFDTIVIKAIAQVASITAARKALEKYDELRASKVGDNGS